MRRLNLLVKATYIVAALLLLIPLATAQEPGRFDEGTVFSFHFEEDGGDEVTDLSGNENHGILGGGQIPDWVDGPENYGSALEFCDCSYVEIPASASLDTGEEITFEAWINLNSLTANWSTVYSKNSQSTSSGFHWIYINKDGTLAYQYANGSAYVSLSAAIDWEFGTWAHMAISHKIDGNNGVVKWYIDGEKIQERAYTDKSALVVGGKASIGTYQSSTAIERYALDGKMDEVRLSPWVKTDAEIVESMNAYAVRPYQKLAVAWGRVKVRKMR